MSLQGAGRSQIRAGRQRQAVEPHIGFEVVRSPAVAADTASLLGLGAAAEARSQAIPGLPCIARQSSMGRVIRLRI